MKMTPLKLAVAAVLAAGATAATNASAETYGQAWNAYQAAQNSYYNQQSTYNASQAAYNAARAKYEADRAAYDARWGYGAYARAYGPFVWNQPAYSYNYPTTTYPTTTYPYSSYPYASTSPYSTTYPYASNTSPYSTTYPYASNPYSSSYPYNNPYYAGAYGANSAYTGAVPCSTTSSTSTNLSVLSALAQAAMGGSVSTSNVVNQAILGAAVDNALGRQSKYTARCDSRGYYYTYAQTQPYREGYYDSYGRWHATAPSSQYASCRLAPAPTDAYGQTYRYVRVCPDSSGRYRITG